MLSVKTHQTLKSKNIFDKTRQAGYLLEVPLLMMAVGILLAIFLPLLPKIIAKILLLIGVLIWIFGSYYMLIIPGWQPDTSSRLHFPWNWLAFITMSAVLLFVAAIYVWNG